MVKAVEAQEKMKSIAKVYKAEYDGIDGNAHRFEFRSDEKARKFAKDVFDFGGSSRIVTKMGSSETLVFLNRTPTGVNRMNITAVKRLLGI